ncbi:MAG: hypothetical protein OIF57_12580 [Marinobacterium sp.]|nr:hypothetical protein [Marinobacterium sp.]
MNETRKRIAHFWDQVESTIDQLLESQQGDRFDAESLLTQYRDHLHKVDRNLTFHFEKDDEVEGPLEMIFGCDGYPESINAVLHVVGEAPIVSGVTFKAFNARYDPVPTEIALGDELCELKDFWFALRPVRNRLHLEVYLRDVPDVLDMDPRVEAVMIYLDALLGEYELMTRVWKLDWLELPEIPLDYGLQPLADLRSAFDSIKHDVMPVGIRIH